MQSLLKRLNATQRRDWSILMLDLMKFAFVLLIFGSTSIGTPALLFTLKCRRWRRQSRQRIVSILNLASSV